MPWSHKGIRAVIITSFKRLCPTWKRRTRAVCQLISFCHFLYPALVHIYVESSHQLTPLWFSFHSRNHYCLFVCSVHKTLRVFFTYQKCMLWASNYRRQLLNNCNKALSRVPAEWAPQQWVFMGLMWSHEIQKPINTFMENSLIATYSQCMLTTIKSLLAFCEIYPCRLQISKLYHI